MYAVLSHYVLVICYAAIENECKQNTIKIPEVLQTPLPGWVPQTLIGLEQSLK